VTFTAELRSIATMAHRILRLGSAVMALWLCLGAAMAVATEVALARVTAPAGIAAPAATGGRAASAIGSTAALDRTLTQDLHEAGGHSSALVLDADTGQILFSQGATTPRLPASVEKLFTTSAALFEFGSAGRFQTRVYGVGSLRDGVFTGKLYLKGGGDPTFGDRGFDRELYGTGASVQSLLTDLRGAGVRMIRGSIIGDPTIFDSRGGGPDSGYRAATETEGELSGLAYDAGWTSSAEVDLQPNPALWATQAFAAAAPSQGIEVARGTKLLTGRTPADATLLAHIGSPPLSTLLKLTNAPSDNFFAETLDKDLGAYWGAGGTTSDGAAIVKRVVGTDLGLSERTDDGSGLSHSDRTTAQTVVELLEEMQSSPAFYDSLAVAGESGTMVDEMLDSPAADNCRGKTGTLSDVANLVGYCTAANGDHLIFAFLENGLVDTTYGHETEDLMGEAMAEYDGNGIGSKAALTLPQPDAGAGVPTGSTLGSSAGSTGSSSGVSGSSTTTATAPQTTTTPTSPGGGGGGL
jgi:D-alanyl-D-alanine carboxypeptidase/D-alanyl-D-alanine-endopeptidase (penicillin-binding protein 4)